MAVRLSNTPLPASVAFTQEWRDRFQEDAVVAVRGFVYSDKAGTLYLEESDDAGATDTDTVTLAVAAATTAELPWTTLTKRWYRFRYLNDAAAQASFVLYQQVQVMSVEDALLGYLNSAAVTNPASAGGLLAFTKGLLSQLQGTGSGAAPIQKASDFPVGATPFFQAVTSGANAAATATVAAVAGKKHYVLGYLVALRAAAAGADALAVLKDDATAKITDVIGNASPVGTRVGIASAVPLFVSAAVNKTVTLNIDAAGAGAITEGCIWGYTL